MKVMRRMCSTKVQVVADAAGVVPHTGSTLLVELAARLGLTAGLSEARAPTRRRRPVHDPGRVVRNLAVILTGGADCLSDLGRYAIRSICMDRLLRMRPPGA